MPQLIDKDSVAHVEECRAFNAAMQAAAGNDPQPDLTTPEGLQAARGQLSHRPPEPRAVERIARAGGGEVPVRVLTPEEGNPRATCLEIHRVVRAELERGTDELLDQAPVPQPQQRRHRQVGPGGGARNDEAGRPEEVFGLLHEPDGGRLAVVGGRRPGVFGCEAVVDAHHGDPERVGQASVPGVASGCRAEVEAPGRSPSGRAYGDEWFIQAYAGHMADRTNPGVSPLYGDLHGLPPTPLVVGTVDVLLEDNLAIAGRLSAAGNDVDLRVYPESAHGFTSYPTAMAAAALERIETWISGRLDEETPPRVGLRAVPRAGVLPVSGVKGSSTG